MRDGLGLVALALAAAVGVSACGGEAGAPGEAGATIEVDGSSTVYPITEAVAEEFMAETGGETRVTVGVSGTGGGFKRFCAGETSISNASRAIKQSEIEACRQAGIEYLELPVAIDGLAVVVHPENSFVQCMTQDELKRIWEPGSTVETWSDVRPEWPAEEIALYGPGTDSGTFDYFTEEVVGEGGASRPDYTASENDEVLVQGVSGDRNALGYFGYAYYEANPGALNLVGIGEDCVEPTPETVRSGEYPLSRPLFLYVNRSALAQNPAVADFLRFYMETAPELVREVGYVAQPAEVYQENLQEVAQVTGGGA